jgi:hypothetical protein
MTRAKRVVNQIQKIHVLYLLLCKLNHLLFWYKDKSKYLNWTPFTDIKAYAPDLNFILSIQIYDKNLVLAQFSRLCVYSSLLRFYLNDSEYFSWLSFWIRILCRHCFIWIDNEFSKNISLQNNFHSNCIEASFHNTSKYKLFAKTN